jgi:hypothetical protein
MDTRTKIVSAERAPRACTVVTGTFDVVVAEDARELAGIRLPGSCWRSARGPNWQRRYAW